MGPWKWMCARLTRGGLWRTDAALYSHLEEILGPATDSESASAKRCWLAEKSWEESPFLSRHGGVVPLRPSIFPRDPESPPFSFHLLSCVVKKPWLSLLRSTGSSGGYIMLPAAEPLPRSLLQTQKVPVVLRRGPESRRADAHLLRYSQGQRTTRSLWPNWPGSGWGCELLSHWTPACIGYFTLRCGLQGFSVVSQWFSCRVTINQTWQKVSYPWKQFYSPAAARRSFINSPPECGFSVLAVSWPTCLHSTLSWKQLAGLPIFAET